MKVGIVGAGASGMMAAVTAAEYGASVILFEKNDRVGRKILATGNGKCNLGNLDFSMDKYYCEDKEKLQRMFSLFSVEDTITFFKKNGMLVKNKNGYLYPYSEQASTVLDIFRKILDKQNIAIITESEITKARYHQMHNCFTVESRAGNFKLDRLILSCGSTAGGKKKESFKGMQIAESFGHSAKRPVPGLVQLCSSDSFIKGMAGVRVQAGLKLFADDKLVSEEQGELQFTEYGISGIPVFQFSRVAGHMLLEGKRVFAKINLLPDYEEREFKEMISRRFDNMKDAALEEFLLGMVNKKINTALMKHKGLKPQQPIGELGLDGLLKFMSDYQCLTVHIDSTNGMENAQVCAGGIDFSEVDERLQSTKQKGLYLTGELLDIDGKCGGYNLQWAWSSGYIAGRSAASKEDIK